MDVLRGNERSWCERRRQSIGLDSNKFAVAKGKKSVNQGVTLNRSPKSVGTKG